jgi:hypothetical protein
MTANGEKRDENRNTKIMKIRFQILKDKSVYISVYEVLLFVSVAVQIITTLS